MYFISGRLFKLALLTSAVLTFLAAWVVVDYDTQRAFDRDLESVNAEGVKLSTALVTQLAILNTMAQSVAATAQLLPDLDHAKFEKLAAKISQERQDIINIAYAPGLVVRHVYPLEPNAAALGLDYRVPSKFSTGVDLALERDSAVLIGPVQIIQGGSALILREPVKTAAGAISGERGIISLVVDLDRFMSTVGMDTAKEEFNIAVFGGASLDAQENLILGSASSCGPDVVRREFSVIGNPWTLCISPKAGWPKQGENTHLIWMGALLVVISTTVIFLVINHLRIREVTAKRQLWDAVEALNIGFVLYDAEDRMVSCNSKYLEMYKDNSGGIRIGRRFRNILEGAAGKDQIVAAKGREKEWLDSRMAAHLSPDGNFEQELSNGICLKVFERKTFDGGIAGFHVDITDLKRAQDEAEASKIATTEFLNNINHEIRTPLSVIVGFIGFLAAPKLLGSYKTLASAIDNRDSSRAEISEAVEMFVDQIKFQAERVQQSSTHLLELVKDTLDLSQAQNGQLSFKPVDVALTPLVDEAIYHFKHQAEQKGLVLRCSLTPVELRADPNRLRQILTHVIGNAVKFTPSGSVVVTNKIEGDWSVITVKDTGPGIAKQHRERIFDTFWQADGSATRDYEGTGLGLAISRKLVDLHGGEFWLDEEVASGSTFHIRLPKAKPVETAEIAAE